MFNLKKKRKINRPYIINQLTQNTRLRKNLSFFFLFSILCSAYYLPELFSNYFWIMSSLYVLLLLFSSTSLYDLYLGYKLHNFDHINPNIIELANTFDAEKMTATQTFFAFKNFEKAGFFIDKKEKNYNYQVVLFICLCLKHSIQQPIIQQLLSESYNLSEKDLLAKKMDNNIYQEILTLAEFIFFSETRREGK